MPWLWLLRSLWSVVRRVGALLQACRVERCDVEAEYAARGYGVDTAVGEVRVRHGDGGIARTLADS